MTKFQQERERFVTDQMCEGLKRLQRVKSYDLHGATYAAYAGIDALDVRGDETAQRFIAGRSLAIRVHNVKMGLPL